MTQEEKDDMKKIVTEGMEAAKKEGLKEGTLLALKSLDLMLSQMEGIITVEVIIGVLDNLIKELEK